MNAAAAGLAVRMEYHRQVDAALIDAIERIEGRVPTNAEISMHCFRGIYPDGHSEFRWKNITVATVHWWPEPGIAFKIVRMKPEEPPE